MQFERIVGEIEALRAILKYIRAHPPQGIELLAPMSPAALAAVGIKATDTLEMNVPLSDGHASVHLLVTDLGLTVNRLAAAGYRDILSLEERRYVLDLVLTKSVLPAFHATPECAIVVREAENKRTVTPSSAHK